MHSKTFSQHLRNAQYCGLRWRLLILKSDFNQQHSTDHKKFRVIRERCNSKACATCARLRFNKIRNKLKLEAITTKWRFFTLTSVNNSQSSEEKLQNVEAHFRELRKKLKRKFPDFKYIAVKELSPSGMWHYHGLWNIYIDVKELSEIWENISGAYRVNLQTVRSPRGAINYIFKYCFKSIFNSEELRILYECDKRKFSTSSGLLNRGKTQNPYTCELSVSYSVDEIKEKLYNLILTSDSSVDDFCGPDYPYFEDLIFNLFHRYYEEHPPNLFSIAV